MSVFDTFPPKSYDEDFCLVIEKWHLSSLASTSPIAEAAISAAFIRYFLHVSSLIAYGAGPIRGKQCPVGGRLALRHRHGALAPCSRGEGVWTVVVPMRRFICLVTGASVQRTVELLNYIAHQFRMRSALTPPPN